MVSKTAPYIFRLMRRQMENNKKPTTNRAMLYSTLAEKSLV
jgi:hypothetical protein